MKYFNSAIILLVAFSIGVESYFWITATPPMEFMMPLPIIERFGYYYSFFTVLSNLALAIGCSLVIQKPLYRNQIITVLRVDAIVGVMITTLVYNTVLRSMHHPELTILKVTNECLHVINPLLGIVGWLLFDPHPRINKKIILYSSLPPVGYLIFIYIKGAITGWYPYPFLDVARIGYAQALFNTLLVAIIFIIFAIVLYAIDKKLSTNGGYNKEL